MDSVKTNSDKYALVEGKAIAGVVLVPDGHTFIIYVAWEWENMARKKFFAITKSFVPLESYVLQFLITNTADYGTDVTNDLEARKLFPLLF